MRCGLTGSVLAAVLLVGACIDQPTEPGALAPAGPNLGVVSQLDPPPATIWGRVSGGGQLLNGAWHVSFAGQSRGLADWTPSERNPNYWTGYDMEGEWVVQFHNVSNPAISGGTFKTTSIPEILFALSAVPQEDCNAAAHVRASGRFNGQAGWWMRLLMTDVGAGVPRDVLDKARVYLVDPSGAVAYGTEASGDFPLEGSCIGPHKSGVDRGNVRVELR